MNLKDKRALIIGGGGTGIGRAVTRRFGSAGASLAVADLDPERAADAAADVCRTGATAYPLSGDVRSRRDLEDMVACATSQLGGLDVLVTVVGGQVAFVPAGRLHETTDADWDTVYEVNLRYVARAVRAVLPVFLKQDQGGSIVSVGSVTGFMAAPRQAGYGVAKAGLLSLARTVAAEYAVERIRMNVVAAGAIATAAAGSAGFSDAPQVPLGRRGSPQEIADGVAYLASDAAAYVTGQQIIIDGGVSVRGPFA